MFENFKDFVEDIKEWNFDISDVKDYFLWWWKLILWIIWFIMIFWFFYLMYFTYWNYKIYKKNYIENKIYKYNLEVLSSVYKKRKKEINKINKIQIPKIDDNFSEYKLICLFLKINWDKFVNDKFFISNVFYDNKKNKFNIWLQWIKYYDDLIKILLITKIFNNIISINRYSVTLKNESNWWGSVSYYDIKLNWQFKTLENNFKSINWFTKNVRKIK